MTNSLARGCLPAAALLAVAGSLVAQDTPAPAATPSREARVLELLSRIAPHGGHLHSTRVAIEQNAFGCELVVPNLRGLCGTGWRQAFQPALARAFAAELCAIYGLAVERAAPAPANVAAQLDAFDREAGIGLKLRGVVEDKALPHGGAWPTVVDEPAATDLDLQEHATLLAANVRVHTADVSSFWAAHSGDRLTTTMCYLASVGTFLNRVTPGEDVDWSALLAWDGRWLPVSFPKSRAGLVVENWSGGGGCTLIVERATELRLAFDPARGKAAWPSEVAGPLPNDGKPVSLGVWFHAERGTFRATLLQAGADGREAELASTAGAMLFAPSRFDAGRPFTIAFALQPGQYRLNSSFWLSGPAPRAK